VNRKINKEPVTQAVILAAGLGARLGPAAEKIPKCLMKVGGKTLLRHHLDILRGLGIDEIIVVAGFGIEQVIAEVPEEVKVVNNEIFSQTNSLYSLWLARDLVAEGFMLINGDVLAATEIYREVVESGGTVLAYDSGSIGEEEEMKVAFREGQLKGISKEMDAEEADGENVGILKFDSSGAQTLFSEVNQLIKEGGENFWAPAAVGAMASKVRVQGIDVKRHPWTEIDFPEDLENARGIVWPEIEASASARVAKVEQDCSFL
jgi:choline kinase